jgi:hypothetical protein
MQDQEPEGFTHRVTNAACADPPPSIRAGAVNSVFGLGAIGATVGAEFSGTKAERRARRLVATLQSCDDLSTVQLAEALQVSRSTVTATLNDLIAEGRVRETRRDAKVVFYGLQDGRTHAAGAAATAGLSQPWKPARKPSGAARAKARAATGRRKSQAQHPANNKAKASTPAHALVPEVTGVPPRGEWKAAFFSSGEMLIEANGDEVRFSPEQAAGFVGWLRRVDAAMQEAT